MENVLANKYQASYSFYIETKCHFTQLSSTPKKQGINTAKKMNNKTASQQNDFIVISGNT